MSDLIKLFTPEEVIELNTNLVKLMSGLDDQIRVVGQTIHLNQAIDASQKIGKILQSHLYPIPALPVAAQTAGRPAAAPVTSRLGGRPGRPKAAK